MKKIFLVLFTAAGLAGATTALAAGSGWYVVGAVGQVDMGPAKSLQDKAFRNAGFTGFTSSLNRSNTIYRLQAGYRISKNLAVEGGYTDLGQFNYSASGGTLPITISASANVHAWNLDAVGLWPLADQFSLLAKVGVADVKISGSFSNGVGINGSQTDLTYGLGAKYNFTHSVALRVDLDNYKFGDSTYNDRTNAFALGVVYEF